ncbi:MAG: Bax inhibitor-1/YccA family protein [Dehalococcoidia bacterium]
MAYLSQGRMRAGSLSSGLLSKVFGLLAFSLVFATLGGVVGARYAQGWLLPLLIVQVALIFAVHALRNREGWNLGLLYGFTFVSGMTVGTIIARYVGAGLGGVVVQAAGVTGLMTVGLSAYALTTKRNLSGLGPALFIALLGLIVASIVGLFVGGGLLRTFIVWGGAVLFSLLLVYDVNRARYAEDTLGNAVIIALGVYLDIVNLFLYILQILTSLQGGSSRE